MNANTPVISPSILAANPMLLGPAIESVENANQVHVDIMDGHFVPNLNGGPGLVKGVVDLGVLPADVHLMVSDPGYWAPKCASLGAASVTFHAEAAKGPLTLARKLKSLGAEPGIAFRPTTPVEPYLPFLGEFGMVLIMTVEPGFGGQTFLPETLQKVTAVRKRAKADGLDLAIQVDGGIDRNTIGAAAKAGANVFVAGSAVFGAVDPAKEVEALREIATAFMPASGPLRA